VLQFTRDPAVPPTNNEAERALWPLKVQQRISGSFRSAEGARNHVVLRTVLEHGPETGLEPAGDASRIAGQTDRAARHAAAGRGEPNRPTSPKSSI